MGRVLDALVAHHGIITGRLNMLSLLGYTNPLSVSPGEVIEAKVSVESGAATYRAQLVRLYCGDDNPNGPGFRAVNIDSSIDGEYPARHQPAHAGSYVQLPTTTALQSIQSFTVIVVVWASALRSREQTLIGSWSARSHRGFGLFIGPDGAPMLKVGDANGTTSTLTSGIALVEREWTVIAASFDSSTATAQLAQVGLAFHPERAEQIIWQSTFDARPDCTGLPLLMGASGDTTSGATTCEHFNGKLERPRLFNTSVDVERWAQLLSEPASCSPRGALLGAWNFSRGLETTRVWDDSDYALHGETVNLPTRAVTSSAWNGEYQRAADKPEHYAAIQFHDDDVYDLRWQSDFRLTVPKGLPSGIYAFHLNDGAGEDYLPFFVRAHRSAPKAKIALLASTATYIAYTNNHSAYNETLEEMQWGTISEVTPADVYLSSHPELGVCLYDSHSDGTPVFYSSRHRPILDMRPLRAPWNFCADLNIVDWLDRHGYEADVITDEDLDSEGVALLDGYTVLLTGSHPEYWSARMLDGLQAFQSGGGRLMYLGGNGFYWRVTFNNALPGVLECRKTEGVRLLDAPAGERHHSFDGELGGLWRRLGRAPQSFTGVGTTAFGFANCGHFRRAAGSYDPRAAFVFEGIGDEPIGNFGATGGAAGLEVDRTDRSLGTPAHCLVLAVSEPLGRNYVPAPEETPFIHPALSGDENPDVRAEMVFFEGPNAGAVFSTGSISWAASLAHNNFDNNVSRITQNVLNRFLDVRAF